MIDLAFTLFLRGQDQAYAMGLAAAYTSIRQRTKACLRLHVIVDDSVDGDMQEKLYLMLRKSDQIAFYSASSLPDVKELAQSLDSRFSPAIVWRLWLADYLGALPRCVLLDCDLLFQADIQELWDLDLGDNVLSAPLRGHPHSPALHDWLQVSPEEYFRACCCLIDLEKLSSCCSFVENRREFLMESQRMCVQGVPQAGLLEQSVFNRFFSKLCTPLPLAVIPVERLKNHPREADWKSVLLGGDDCILDIKGWSSQSPYAIKFWSLLLDTPWRTEALRFCEGRLN